MKTINKQKTICLVVLALAFTFGSVAAAQTQDERQRTRTVASPTPAPRQTPPVKPTPAVSPTPATTPTPAARVQTTVEMQQQIRSVLLRPEIARARVGVKIVSLDTGKTVFEDNADKYFMPASNMKSFTMAAALDRLTPNFRFVTSVYAAQKPDAAGTIRGDLTIYGRGDPSFSAAFNDNDYYRGINNLADKIAASGVKRIEGSLVGDESYFSGDPIGASWEWDDLQWYYGAGISALTVNDNAVELKIAPASVGEPCVVTVAPANSLFTIVNLTQTVSASEKRQLEVFKPLGTNVLEIRGTMPQGDKGYSAFVAVEKPAEMFVSLLKNALQQKGVAVAGQMRVVTAKMKAEQNRPPAARSLPLLSLNNAAASQIEIARLESPPLSLIAQKTLKPSQNLYTELTLRALGETAGDKTDPKKTSAERGVDAAQQFFTEAGIAPGSVVQRDGSGLSRHNLITPNALVQLYSYMNRHRYADVWRAALTIAAIDGTLSNRFKNTVAAGNVRGKTGTISQVSTLSGYVTTAAGEQLAFAVLVNNLPGSSAQQRAVIDDIVLSLANFNGRTNGN